MSRFGKTVRKLRMESGLSLGEVATQAGLSKGYICGIESQKLNPPSVKVIRKLAKVLGQDAKPLIRLAWVDKAPAIIRQEARQFLGWFLSRHRPREKIIEAGLHGASSPEGGTGNIPRDDRP